MGKVSIVRTNEGIKSSLQNALDLIGGLESYISSDEKVMLKPNLNGTEGITNIELVEALIRLLLDFRVKNIVIAESTFGSQQMTDMCFNKSGYVELAKKYGIKLINLNRSEIVEVEVRKPLELEKLNIAREVFEVDKIINIPVMKVHYATGITLALKNLKGLLVRDEKRHFHEVGLDKAIVDLNNTIKPGLNIIDCISCMERMGPKGGDIVSLNLLVAGSDCAEVDYIGSLLMGYQLEEVKHLKYYIEENKINLDKIELVGERIEDVKYGFKKVEMENIIPNGFMIYNKNACSSCMNALLLSCQFLEKDLPDNVEIYLGSVVEESSSDVVKIAFGNCCKGDAFFDKVVKGCPPFPFTLKEVLEK
jgi:uncharacterized protein (DUF362 family)